MTPTKYNTIHAWNLRNWAKSGCCENCLEYRKTQWSNRSGKYLRDRLDWQELCSKCHIAHDIKILGSRHGKRGKDKKPRKNRYKPEKP